MAVGGGSPPVRLLIVDPDPSSRNGLESFFDRDPAFEVVASTGGSEGVGAFLQEGAVDLVLLDGDMPDSAAAAVLGEIRGTGLSERVVVMTSRKTERVLRQAAEAGVTAFVEKHEVRSRLADSLLRAADGQIVLSDWPSGFLSTLSSALRDQDEAAREVPEPVPQRLHPVYRGVLEGLTNRMIARREGLAETTVRTYVSELLDLLGCGSRTELVAKVLGTSAT